MPSARVCCSYAHEDRAHMEALSAHLAQLERDGEIALWSDRRIVAGQDWHDSIQREFADADVLIYLVSAALMKSDYVQSHELFAAEQRQQRGERVLVVPLLVEPTHNPERYFHRVQEHIQMAPVDEQGRLCAISDYRPSAAAGYVNAVEELMRAIERYRHEPPRTRIGVPVAAEQLVGRELLLERLARLLDAPDRPSRLALVGPGGIGKTAVAVAFCRRPDAGYRHIVWLDAERPERLTHAYAQAAEQVAGLSPLDTETTRDAFRTWLARNDGWLLVFDNATDPELLRRFLPDHHRGHVLISSREQVWDDAATTVPVRELSHEQAVAFLEAAAGDAPGVVSDGVDAVADLTGGLPLALVQAAGATEAGGSTLGKYAAGLHTEARAGARDGVAPTLDDTVAATTRMSLRTASELAPSAHPVLTLCAFLAPNDIARRLLFSGAASLPPQERAPFASAATLLEPIEALENAGLVSIDGDAISIHRRVQAAIRNDLPPLARKQRARAAGRLVLSAFPARPQDEAQASWAARVRPHAAAVADHLDALEIDPELAVRLRAGAARVLLAGGQVNSAAALLERAAATARRTTGESRLQAVTLTSLADAELARGYVNAARERAQAAYGILSGSLTPDGADAQRGASGGVEAAGQPPAAEAQALLDDPDLADVLAVLGRIAHRRGDLERALDFETEALRMRLRLAAGPDAAVADSWDDLFGLLLDRNAVGDAIWALQQSIEVRAAVAGDDDGDVALNRKLLAIMTEPETAVEQAREVLAHMERTRGSDHPLTFDSCRLLAQVLRRIEQLDEARRMARRAHDGIRRTFGEQHYLVAKTLLLMMEIDAADGDLAAAERSLAAAAAIARAAPAREAADTVRLLELRLSLADSARDERARPLLSQAGRVLEATFDDPGALTAAREELFGAHLAVGDHALMEGQRDSAAALYGEAARYAELTVDTPFDDAEVAARLALLAAVADDVDQALAQLRRCVAHLTAGGQQQPVWATVAHCARLAPRLGQPAALVAAADTLIDQSLEEVALPLYTPTISAAPPDGWNVKESLTLLAPDGQANVIVSSEPLNSEVDSSEYARLQGDLLENEFPGYEQHGFEPTELFGRGSGYLREFSWLPPDDVAVTQVQLYYVERGRGYTATATTPSEGYAERALVLRETLRALRVSGG